MSIEEGKAFYKKLILLAAGESLPDRTDSYEWITYDTWATMRARDEKLTSEVLKQAIVCVVAQVDEKRTKLTDMGALLKQRAKEGGIA